MKTTQTDAGRAAKPRRRYNEEFKERAVQLLGEGQRTQRALAAELGINEVTLGQWKRRYGTGAVEGGLAGPAGTAQAGRNAVRPVAAAQEVAQLRRQLEHMTRQRDILKKALSIFSQGALHSSR